MKLLIGMPSLDYMHTDTVRCLSDLVIRLTKDRIPFDLDLESGTLVYKARDRVANKAINEEYTHVLWLDSDMIFSTDILDDLMFCGKDFVTGVAHARRRPHQSCIFTDLNLDNIQKFQGEYPKDPFRIAGCGFAGVLTKVDSVLKPVMMQYGTCFLPTLHYGEDVAFCQRATKMGIEIWCDPGVVLGHIGHIAIYPEDHERWRDSISNYDEVVHK